MVLRIIFFILLSSLFCDSTISIVHGETGKRVEALNICRDSINEALNCDLPNNDYNKNQIINIIEKGFKLCTKAGEISEADGTATFLLGTLLFAKIKYNDLLKLNIDNELKQSIKNFSEAIRIGIKDINDLSMCYNNRGYAYFLLEKYEYAKKDFENAIKINSGNIMSKNNLEILNKRLSYIDLVKNTENEETNDIEKLKKLVSIHLEMKELNSAKTAADKLINLLPDSYEAFFIKGIINLELKENKEAYTNLSRAIDLNQNFSDAYLYRSYTYTLPLFGPIEMDKLDLRINDLEKALKLKPDLPEALWSLGLSYEKKGYDKAYDSNSEDRNSLLLKAINLFDSLTKLNAKYDIRIYRFQANWYSALKPPQLDRSINIRKKGVELYDSDLDIHLLAEDYRKKKDYDSAISLYNKVLKKEPRDLQYQTKEEYQIRQSLCYIEKAGYNLYEINKLGSLKKDDKNIAEALKILKQVNEKLLFNCKGVFDTPNNNINTRTGCLIKQEVLGYLGFLNEGLGDKDQAIKFLTEAIEVSDNNTLYTHRAILFDGKGLIENALADCKKSTSSGNGTHPFGSTYCTNEYINRLENSAKSSYNIKLNEIVKSSSDNSCGNLSYNYNSIGSNVTLSLSSNLQVTFNKSGIISVSLPKALSDQISFIAKEKNLPIVADLSLPFYNWFIGAAIGIKDFKIKKSQDDLIYSLCYLNSLVKNSKFKIINSFIYEYLNTVQ